MSIIDKGFCELRRNIARYQERYGKSQAYYYFDFARAFLIHGASPADYDYYGMYRLSHLERREVVTFRRHQKLNKQLNDYSRDTSILTDKGKFLSTAKDWIHRDWIVSRGHTKDELLDFLARHAMVFYKPLCGMKGHDVHRLKNDPDGRAFIQSHFEQKMPFIPEEQIKQHPLLRRINPHSVNTLRVYTLLLKNGDVDVLHVGLRTASDAIPFDNMAQGGIVFPVDVTTGVVVGCGRSFVHPNAVIFHPMSHVKVLGLEIPHWDRVLNTCRTCAKQFPDFRYIGWDVAVTEAGVDLVEANLGPGPRTLQTGDVFQYRYIKRQI